MAEHHSLPLEGKVSPQATDEVSYDTITYQYDTRGNILSKTYALGDTAVDTITYGYTDAKWKDRLTSYNGVSISYDTIGNPLSWHNGATMSWQRGRQLASYTKNGTTTSFTYDDGNGTLNVSDLSSDYLIGLTDAPRSYIDQ